VKYACIAEHQQHFPIALMCRVLGVSRSGFYAAQRRAPSQRTQTDQRLQHEINAIHRRSRRTYGSPRVHAELREQGVRCGRKRVERLMRAAGLQAKRPHRTRRTTNSCHPHPVAPNVVNRRFGVTDIAAPNRVWASDITYVPTREGWLYLAVILDLASRLVVGWAMQATLEQSLTHAALHMAVGRRRPSPGVVHHSDRGVQYAATDYQRLLATQGMTPSMSRKGDCYDNAVVESFFATLEWELIDGADWHTRAQARSAIFEYIEVWYNRQRRHSTLSYRSPVAYEQVVFAKQAAA
jgi:transposase InsO family protein